MANGRNGRAAVRKPRVLVVHPRLRSTGGGNLMAAWTLEALRSDFDISLATLEPLDYAALNDSFATSLREGDFQVHIAPPGYQRILRHMPTQGALLEICLTMRWAQDLDRQGRYDVIYGTCNEMDFHRRGVQYVNYPWFYLPRPEIELSWFHRIPGLLWTYRRSCLALARATPSGLRRNLMLANSQFVVGQIRKAHGTDAQIVHPPVPGDFVELPFEQRRLAMAAVGRVHPGKRWEMAVEIVESIRRRGHNLELTLIGHGDIPAYEARLQAMAASRPWFRWIRDASRAQLLAELSQHRYGIHTMPEEHFGIAPAELQRAGCITFVHNSGGQVEIVGGDSRLTFDSVEDASERIARVIENPGLEHELRGQVAERRSWFTAERFCDSVREIVTQFATNGTGTELRPTGSAKSATA
jgi:glycosyltransferase involved in cell wall biosynthesis